MPYTDIAQPHWIQRLPNRWQAYAVLMRLDRPIGAWLLFLPGFWSIALTARGIRLVWLLTLFAFGSVLMRSAGCIINDAWDRDLDRKVARTAARPLASGQLGLSAAIGLLAALLGLSLCILLQLNRLSQLLGVMSLILVAFYPLAKRITWWAQLFLGFTFGWGALMGYAASTNRIDWHSFLLYAAVIFWILGYDTIYAFQDQEDDALIGIRSTARLFAKSPRTFLICAYTLTIMLLITLGILVSLSSAYFLLLGIASALLLKQVVLLDADTPAQCLTLFKSNRDVGLIIGLAFLAGRL